MLCTELSVLDKNSFWNFFKKYFVDRIGSTEILRCLFSTFCRQIKKLALLAIHVELINCSVFSNVTKTEK